MFKKSSNLIHLNERRGSHATKGGARGTPWFEPISDEEKEIIEIRRACAVIRRQLSNLKVIRERAKKTGRKDIAKECAQQIRRLIKDGKRLARSKGIDDRNIRW